VVAGIRQTEPIAHMKEVMPKVYAQFAKIAKQLEKHYRDVQDVEFTIERGKLWMLQTRDAKRTAAAAIRIAVDLADEKLITKAEAVKRVSPDHIDYFLHPQFKASAKKAGQQIATGLNVSPGAAVGQLAFDADTAERLAHKEKKAVIMVRPETKPDDVHGMLAAKGILTSRGGRTSHAALVARQFGKPAVVGVLTMDGRADDGRRCREPQAHDQGRRRADRGRLGLDRRHDWPGLRRPDRSRGPRLQRPVLDQAAQVGGRHPQARGVGQRRLPA